MHDVGAEQLRSGYDGRVAVFRLRSEGRGSRREFDGRYDVLCHLSRVEEDLSLEWELQNDGTSRTSFAKVRVVPSLFLPVILLHSYAK